MKICSVRGVETDSVSATVMTAFSEEKNFNPPSAWHLFAKLFKVSL